VKLFDAFNPNKIRRETELKIVLAKLQFLSAEFAKGADQKADVRFWEEQLRALNELDDGKNEVLTYAKEAYESLYRLFLVKHELINEEERESFVELAKRVYDE